MKVELTGKRSNETSTLFGVKFISGKAVLNASEVQNNVFGNLLSRYHPVVKSDEKPVEVEQIDPTVDQSAPKAKRKRRTKKQMKADGDA